MSSEKTDFSEGAKSKMTERKIWRRPELNDLEIIANTKGGTSTDNVDDTTFKS